MCMTLNAARRFAIIASACMLTLGASACSTGSGDSEQSRPSAPPTAEVRMSGGYVMNEDGTLQKPEVDMPAPVLDPAALEYSPEGAELAARHFLALTEYAWATGDTIALKKMSDESCEYCTSTLDRVVSTYSSGGWVSGLHYTVLETLRVEEIGASHPNTFGVQLNVDTSSSIGYEPPRIVEYEKSTNNLSLFLRWSGNDWYVSGGSVSDGIS